MRVLLLLLIILLFAMIFVRIKVNAPELFGMSTGYGFQTARYEILFIPVRWPNNKFFFLMFGHLQGKTFKGSVMQIYGKKIETYGPYECSTPVLFCYERTLQKNWKGWIEFRGHQRPFCGGEQIKSNCRLVTHAIR